MASNQSNHFDLATWADELRRDVRYGARQLWSAPSFTFVAVLTLALGIGATTAIFSVMNAVLLRSLPYRDADRFVRFTEESGAQPGRGSMTRMLGLSKEEIDTLRADARTLSHVGTYLPTTMTLRGRGEVARINGTQLSPPILSMLGQAPLLGRLLELREERDAANHVVVLGHAMWERYLGADPNVLGQRISLDGVDHEVVGVMPQGFRFPDDESQFWVPFVWPSHSRLVTTGRLSDGASLAAATQEVSTILRRLRDSGTIAGQYSSLPMSGVKPGPDGKMPPPPPPPPPPGMAGAPPAGPPDMAPTGPPNAGPPNTAPPNARPPDARAPNAQPLSAAPPNTIRLVSLREQLIAPLRPAFLVLVSAVGLVLLIAAVNVGNMLLARAATREADIAVRLALGASRWRLIRQSLTESLLLALVGGTAGVALAYVGVQLLRTLGAALPRRGLAMSSGLPNLDRAGIDWTVLAFAVAVSAGTGILLGLMPVLRGLRVTHRELLREGTDRSISGLSLFGRQWGRGALVVAQIAMATLLSLGAALLIRSFVKLAAIDPGVNPTGVLTFQVVLPPERPMTTFREDLSARLRALPEVRAASYADQLPLGAMRALIPLRHTPAMPNQPPPAPGGDRLAEFPDLRIVSRAHFDVMGMQILEGRGFLDTDTVGRPQVMLINRTLARSGFFGPHPIGQRIYAVGDTPWEIIGVVDDVRQFGLTAQPGPQIFVDFRQLPASVAAAASPQPYFAVRTDGDPAALTPTIRAALQDVDPRAALDSVATLERLVANSIVQPRMYGVLLGWFSIVAATLAIVGIYGVMSYSIARRRREIGLRMALGAERADVFRLVMQPVLAMIGTGIVLGLAGALAVTRLLEGLLFGVAPRDPATFVGASVLFGLVAALAAFLSARRAARVDPLIALRYD